MKINVLILTILGTFLIVGCSTKREYFSPSSEEISGKLPYTGSISSTIKDTNLKVATLKNGEVLDENGMISDLKLNKDETLIFSTDNKFGISNLNGNFKVIDKNAGVIFQRDFPQAVVAATLDREKLALITANNMLYLVDVYTGSVISSHDAGESVAQDSRVRAPIFVDNLITYPTLNGKIYILDRNYGAIIRQLLVSSEPFFNNVIFYEVIGNSMYAATPTKLMLISPDGNKFISSDIKVVFSYKNVIYTFLNDGEIKAYDRNLNEVAKNKFKFAIYANATAKGNNLYIIEKTGYLIKTNLMLKDEKIYKLSGGIEDRTFLGDKLMIFGKNYIKID